MADEIESAGLEALRLRLEDEESSYAEALAALDELAAFPLPEETGPEIQELLRELNELWASAVPSPGGLAGVLARRTLDALGPLFERQVRFNEVLVRLLNAQLGHAARHHARLRELAAGLVRYAQRVEPIMDARDDMRVARTPTRAEQVLEVFDRRLESMGERLEGLAALRDRIEVLSEEVRAVRGGLEAGAPPPEVARATARAAADSTYTAFENRFRGAREQVPDPLQEGLGPAHLLGDQATVRVVPEPRHVDLLFDRAAADLRPARASDQQRARERDRQQEPRDSVDRLIERGSSTCRRARVHLRNALHIDYPYPGSTLVTNDRR